MRRLLLASAAALVLAAPLLGHAEQAVIAGELRSPESAAWHAGTAAWYVSNMGGVSFDLGPDAGDGFLSKVPENGPVVWRWLDNVERPRGVAAGPNHLFVALGPGAGTPGGSVLVVEIDAPRPDGTTGPLIKHRISIPAAAGDLNDVVYDPATGAVFVSAPSVNAIYRIATPLSINPASRVAVEFVKSVELTQPNGLVLEDGFLVSAGLGLSNATNGGGRVMRIDLISKAITAVTTEELGILDGIVKDGDDYLVTEYVTGTVYRVARDGTSAIAWKLAPGTADLGIDPVRRVIMVPETLANALVTLPVLL